MASLFNSWGKSLAWVLLGGASYLAVANSNQAEDKERKAKMDRDEHLRATAEHQVSTLLGGGSDDLQQLRKETDARRRRMAKEYAETKYKKVVEQQEKEKREKEEAS